MTVTACGQPFITTLHSMQTENKGMYMKNTKVKNGGTAGAVWGQNNNWTKRGEGVWHSNVNITKCMPLLALAVALLRENLVINKWCIILCTTIVLIQLLNCIANALFLTPMPNKYQKEKTPKRSNGDKVSNSHQKSTVNGRQSFILPWVFSSPPTWEPIHHLPTLDLVILIIFNVIVI